MSAPIYIRYPAASSGGSSGSQTGVAYSVGSLDGAPASPNGGFIGSNSFYFQSASATNPGLVSSAAQTFAGVKTFNSAPNLSSLSASAPLRTDSSQNISVGSISLTADVVGNLPLSQTSGSISLTTRVSGVLPAANSSGLNLLSGSVSLTAQVSGVLPTANGGSTGANTGDVTLAAVGASPNANGASLAGQVLNLQPANASSPGALLAADWVTFNAKANASLNNISSTTSVNSSIVPAVDSAIDMGTTALGYSTAYAQNLRSTNGANLVVSASRNSVSGNSGNLTLNTFSATGSTSGNISISTGTAASGVRGNITITGNGITLSSFTNTIDALNSNLINVLDPTTAQMAATKNYVDTTARIGSVSLTNQVVGVLPAANLPAGTQIGSVSLTTQVSGVLPAANSSGLNLLSGSVSLTAQVVGVLPAANLPAGTQIGSVSLTAQVSGILPILNGGTGQSNASLSVGSISLSQSAGGASYSLSMPLSQGSASWVLQNNGSGTLSWSNPATINSVTAITANYTITPADKLLLMSSSAYTATLYSAVGNMGSQITIKKTDSFTSSSSNNALVATTGGQTINGSGTSIAVATQNETWVLISDNVNWQVKNHTIPSIWAAYTPTFSNFGTVASVSFVSRRNGDSLEIQGTWTNGTVAAGEPRVSIGFNGLDSCVAIDSSGKVAANRIVGLMTASTATTTGFTTGTPALTYVRFSAVSGTQAGTAIISNATTTFTTGALNSLTASVPIQGWNG